MTLAARHELGYYQAVKTTAAVRRYMRLTGLSPTYRELGRLLGLRSSATVWQRVFKADMYGLLRTLPGASRSIVPVEESGHCAACGQTLPESL